MDEEEEEEVAAAYRGASIPLECMIGLSEQRLLWLVVGERSANVPIPVILDMFEPGYGAGTMVGERGIWLTVSIDLEEAEHGSGSRGRMGHTLRTGVTLSEAAHMDARELKAMLLHDLGDALVPFVERALRQAIREESETWRALEDFTNEDNEESVSNEQIRKRQRSENRERDR